MNPSDKEEKKLTVDVREGKAWKRTLEIEVPKETVDEEFEVTYRRYRAEAKIPGFRKGKAPLEMVKRRFKDPVQKEVLETLVPRAYEDAVKETDLSPINLPEVKEIDFEEGKPLKFQAEIEVKPEVEVKDYTGLEVVKRVKEVSDNDVEQSLKYLREDLAQLQPVQRGAKFYDHLVVDLTKDQGGKTEDLKNHELALDPHNMIKEFQDALLKAKAGEKREFEVDYPDDFHNKKLAGNKVGYKITIKEVKEKILPEENDEFAKTVGKFKTVGELKNKIKEGLLQKARRDAEVEVKNELVNQVIKHNPFEVPDTLFDYYMDALAKDLKEKYKKVDEKKIREDYKEVAIGHIKWDFLFHQIVEKEKIQVTKEDMDAWVENFARDYKMKAEDAKKLVENPSQIKKIREDLLEKKVLDFLRKSAKIKEETIPAQVIVKEDSKGQTD
ncbi:MAG: trigger factor [Candidatus Zixiibacteriota bacterium]|nr:MAG: trigger factor [candidate division Zixibacteria bacterium]